MSRSVACPRFPRKHGNPSRSCSMPSKRSDRSTGFTGRSTTIFTSKTSSSMTRKSWPIGRRAMVSSGIGAALAARYARQGAVLGLCARRLAPTQALFSSLLCAGSCYQVDVTDGASLQAAAADFTERFGVPDIVIANAGISVGTSTESSEDLPAFRKIMDTNVFGMAATFQPFVLPMRARGSGTLVGIASVAGFRGLPGGGAYSASKSAAITYLESLRVELRGSGVAVVTICPGYIRTAMTASNRYRMPFII